MDLGGTNNPRQRGIEYAWAGDYHNAIQAFNQAIALRPKDALSYMNRGMAFASLERNEEAIKDYTQAITLAPKYTQTYQHRARLFTRLRMYDPAIQDLSHLLTISHASQEGEIVYERGRVYFAMQAYELARQDFSRAIGLRSNLCCAFSNRGLIYLALNAPARAESDVIDSCHYNPTATIHSWTVEWYRLCVEEPGRAAERLEALAALDVDRSHANTPLACLLCSGVALWLRQRYDEALAELLKAIAIDRDSRDTHFWIGMTYAAQGQAAEAQVALDYARWLGLPLFLFLPLRLLQSSQPDFYQHYALPLLGNLASRPVDNPARRYTPYQHQNLSSFGGLASLPDGLGDHYSPRWSNLYISHSNEFVKAGLNAHAVQAADEAIAFNPTNETAYNNRAAARLEPATYTLAIQDLNQAIQINPAFSLALTNRAICYRGIRDYEKAMWDINAALSLYHQYEKAFSTGYVSSNQYARAYSVRGTIYMHLDQYWQALQDFERASQLDAENRPRRLNNKGAALCGLKQYEQAMQCFTQALALDSSYHLIWHNLGLAQIALNQVEQGRTSLCKHLELKPDYLRTAWMIEWCHLCFDPFDPAIVARLEKLAATEIHEYDENYELTYVCDSTTLLLRQRYEEALAALDPALALRPVGGDTAFWHGMALAALGRDQEAREALEFAREHGIPLSLFRTLKLLEQANPAFCAQYASEL